MTTTNVLNVTVRNRTKDGSEVYEGVAQLEGGTPFKLTKSRSADTSFTTRSSLTQSAKTFAKRFGLELNIEATGKTKTKTSPRIAAAI